MVPVDGSSRSLHAVEKATSLAKAFHSDLLVVALVDPYPFTRSGPGQTQGHPQYLLAARDSATRALESAREIVKAQGLEATSRLVESYLTWKGILDSSHAFNAELIVMGSHSRFGLQRLVLGSVIQQVLQHATLPVLVVEDPSPVPAATEALTPQAPVDRPVERALLWQSANTISQRIAQLQRRV